jgi:hypothetical protein
LLNLTETTLTLAKLDEATNKSLHESRLAALDGLEKFALSSFAPPSDEFHQSIREAQQQEEDKGKGLEIYDDKFDSRALPGRRPGVEKSSWEFEGDEQTLSPDHRTAAAFEALILKSIM